jgi:three-Cys-motif partner protein
MKNRFTERVYLDLLAGPGRCVDRDSGEEFPGSPVLSLTAPFTQRVFIEADAALADALRSRVGSDPVILVQDCNLPMTVTQARSHVSENALGLAFIDNLGLDVVFSTLSSLTVDRRIDLMITFQVSDLTRNIGNVIRGREDRDRFDAFIGSPGWSAVVEQASARNASASETADALLDFYATQLGRIGYPHVVHSRMVMKNSRNVPQYRLLLAGRHERAVEFFRKIEAIDPVGRRSLF